MKTAFVVTTAFLAANLFITPHAFAQAQPDTTMSMQRDALNLYLDCDFFCDFDYIRTEIPYVNNVVNPRFGN